MDTGQRRSRVLAAVVLVSAALTLGGCGDPVAPAGVNRPDLAPSPIAGRCWPLPGVDRFGFSYQVRTDVFTDGAPATRRVITLQYDLVEGASVAEEISMLLDSGGFTASAPPAGTSADGWIWAERGGYGDVGFRVEDLDVPRENVVRGTLVLDLPRASYDKDTSEICRQPVRVR